MSHPVVTWDVLPPVESPGALLDAVTSTVAPGVDLQLDDDGDLVVDTDAHFTTGLLAVAQGISKRLQMFKGEWFADLDRGVPYFQDILGQRFNKARVRETFRATIAEAPGVTEIRSLEVSLTGRILTVAWQVGTTYGVTSDSLDLGV